MGFRHLTEAEIEKLASRGGVRRIAVVNFLGTLSGRGREGELANLVMDSHLYAPKWNAATVAALRDGINLAYNGGRL